MFTGIIEEIGEVVGVDQRGDSAVLSIAATTFADDLRHCASIAVDSIGTALSRTPGDGWQAVRFALPADLARFVTAVSKTLCATTLGDKQTGEAVKLEVDVLAKYVERLLEAGR